MNNKFLAAAILILALTPFYLRSMNPSVSVGDSGELIAAGATLSLPHAPSYPLFSLLGKAAIALNPFGHCALRVNLLSLFCGLATGAMLFLLALRLGLSFPVSLFSALTLLA